MAQSKFMRGPFVILAVGGLLANCSSGSGVSTLATTEGNSTVMTNVTDTSATDAPTTAVPLGSPDERPEGEYVVIKRLETPDPPYDGFVPGQPDVRNWKIHPKCDSGTCDLEVGPGADGLMPEGSPPPAHGESAFALALQPDGSYFGSADFPDVSCDGSSGTVAHGALFQFTYQLTYTPPSGGEAPRLTGTVLDTQVPNDVGKTAGCIEYHDSESLIAQPRGIWDRVDPAQLRFGTYDWGGRVTAADDYYLANTAKVGDYRVFNSRLAMQSTCTEPCSLHTTGVAPSLPGIAADFTWDSLAMVGFQSFQNTCNMNGTDTVLFDPGYDETSQVRLTPVIIVDGEVLAWIGVLSLQGTPLPAAAAGSPTDCFPTNEQYYAIAATAKPNFGGQTSSNG